MCLALLGMILAIHLWIQKERNFDHGCWGLREAPSLSNQNCNTPELAALGTSMGVPLPVLGYFACLGFASLAFAKNILPARTARRAHLTSEILIVAAFPFAAYLTYFQAFIAKAFCPLCLLFSGVITGIFIVHFVLFFRGGYIPRSDSARPLEFCIATAMCGFALALGVAVMVFLNSNDASDYGTAPQPTRKTIASLRHHEWITPQTPVLGDAAGGIPVVVFIDPNCPHCVEVFRNLHPLAERYAGKASIYVFSLVLWERSLLQTQFLELARQDGKYFDMWRLQMEHLKSGGLDLDELEKLLRQLGLSTEKLDTRLSATRVKVLALRDQVRAAGINSAPTIFVDGLHVRGSRSPAALGKLIEAALKKESSSPKIAEPAL
jgi:uncharacterized membrane protein/predicted DsbA family dithiol-disulfide isomerase